MHGLELCRFMKLVGLLAVSGLEYLYAVAAADVGALLGSTDCLLGVASPPTSRLFLFDGIFADYKFNCCVSLLVA